MTDAALSDGDNRAKGLNLLSRALKVDPETNELESAFAEALAACFAQRLEAVTRDNMWLHGFGHTSNAMGPLLATKLGAPFGSIVRRFDAWQQPSVSATELVARPEEDFLDEAQRQARAKHRQEAMSEVCLKERLGCLGQFKIPGRGNEN
ncbi:unnamed protein product [Cladocopium goreaui]|uniref:Uncharacterized protein n=1 Tax=Cladocopium goreaui TaxID=2562237 RepID=A0A9P1G008_9DINO|nr:unnamed protein product [Cladocopium goreaui]